MVKKRTAMIRVYLPVITHNQGHKEYDVALEPISIPVGRKKSLLRRV